jgi:FMN phosphatase YigB (HAD superfamily)
VVFDLDETLHRLRRFTLGGYAHVAGRIAAETGRDARPLFRRLWQLYRHGQGAIAYQTLCADLGYPTEHASVLLRHHRAHPTRLRLTRSAARAIREMSPTWRIGVLTNGVPELQRIKVAALDLERHVDTIVYADEIAAGGKPAPIVFARVCEELGVPPRRCVMVGDDGIADVHGGRVAGMWTIWVQRPNRPPPPPGDADAVAQSLAEVPDLAARLLGDRRGDRQPTGSA